MKSQPSDLIDQLIESYLGTSLHLSPMRATLRQAIKVDEAPDQGFGKPRHWAPLLPAWCCEAAGGQGELTDISSAAWKLFHIAAHTLDNVADRDPPLNWWRDYGPGVAINTATSLIIAAESLLLNQVENPNRYPFGLRVFKEFNRSLEIICSGQHLDLVQQELGTDAWWEIAAGKSGEPFALACKVGAIIATDEQERIDAFTVFGHHLGVIIQIQDDIHDFIHEDLLVGNTQKEPKISSLPISYALEVLPEKENNYLRSLLVSSSKDERGKEEIIDIVENTGAIVFIETKKNLYKNHAMNSLNLAAEDNPSKQLLVDLLEYLSGP